MTGFDDLISTSFPPMEPFPGKSPVRGIHSGKRCDTGSKICKTSESNRSRDLVGKEARLKKACSELESVFLNYMLKEMRKTIPKSKSGDSFSGKGIYTSMLDMQFSIKMAEQGGIGLARILYQQLHSIEEDLSGPGQGQK